MLTNKSFAGGFLLSAQVGIAATLIGLALAVPASLAIARRTFPGRGAVNALLLMPLIVPGVVLGTAIYVFQIETEDRDRVAAARDRPPGWSPPMC